MTINNHKWDDEFVKLNYSWIKINDTRYQFLYNNLINRIFPVLQSEDKNLLLNGLIKIINLIHIKFGFWKNDNKNELLLWDQLLQNKLLDLRALLAIMLPFISDNESDGKKRKLSKLEDLYLETDENGKFVYTNTQYNRCIRHNNDSQIIIFKRPYLKEYFIDHLELLLMSIETMANKLYINWVDILPMPMNEYVNTKLYKDTVTKIVGKIITDNDNSVVTMRDKPLVSVEIINNYIDLSPGLSYQDVYNVMSNHLFHQIKNYKWLIYDIFIRGVPISYITYLEDVFNLNTLWKGLLWSQMTKNEINGFTNQWNKFLSSLDRNDNEVLHRFYFFYCKYHTNAKKLIRQGKLILTSNTSNDDENEENAAVTPENTRDAKKGMRNVPVDEIYLFMYDQLDLFKKSWFYYMINIKKDIFLIKGSNNIYVTPKNIYNYCKSMTHYTTPNNIFVQIPRHWHSLKPNLIEMVLIRMLDIETSQNNWNKSNWFNINNYFRRFYPSIPESELPKTNFLMHSLIRTKIVDIVFESLIYHGLLSDFWPNKNITNNTNIESAINTVDDQKKTLYKRNQMKEHYFTGQKRNNYENYAYYYLTNATYGDLPLLNFRDSSKKYFDFLTSDQIWTFTYAMNWVSQINFYHHYLNTRVMYITGATGVGKSTQIPKLLIYSQKMLDYNYSGKIVCTQPRVSPTVENAETISKELGVPIRGFSSKYKADVFTANYYVQYKHQKESHINTVMDTFFKIVTDGTLFEELRASPFLTKSIMDSSAVDLNNNKIPWAKLFCTGNKYDIIIVDEAHEHNTYMDMILTLGRDAAYINNSIKLVIISATMEDDEPIYRRYYRLINDNRAHPLSAFIEDQKFDRANMDRRIHISPPGATTQYFIKDVYLSEKEASLINEKNFVKYGIQKTIQLANSTSEKDILLFLSGQADIQQAVKEINAKTAANVIALGFYSDLSDETKKFIGKIHLTLSTYTRFKEDIFLEENDIVRRVPAGTYNRAIIIATNVAEASITLQQLRYVVDTGYAKTVIFDVLEGISKTLTLPISQSSSMQRRGRVGRVASGEVYYLYNKEKIINNKTAYKIADSNVKDLIIKFLKSDPRDSFIITWENDINNINILQQIIDKQKSNEM